MFKKNSQAEKDKADVAKQEATDNQAAATHQAADGVNTTSDVETVSTDPVTGEQTDGDGQRVKNVEGDGITDQGETLDPLKAGEQVATQVENTSPNSSDNAAPTHASHTIPADQIAHAADILPSGGQPLSFDPNNPQRHPDAPVAEESLEGEEEEKNKKETDAE